MAGSTSRRRRPRPPRPLCERGYGHAHAGLAAAEHVRGLVHRALRVHAALRGHPGVFFAASQGAGAAAVKRAGGALVVQHASGNGGNGHQLGAPRCGRGGGGGGGGGGAHGRTDIMTGVHQSVQPSTRFLKIEHRIRPLPLAPRAREKRARPPPPPPPPPPAVPHGIFHRCCVILWTSNSYIRTWAVLSYRIVLHGPKPRACERFTFDHARLRPNHALFGA